MSFTSTDMSHIPDDKLFEYGARVKGKVVVITGAFASTLSVYEKLKAVHRRCERYW